MAKVIKVGGKKSAAKSDKAEAKMRDVQNRQLRGEEVETDDKEVDVELPENPDEEPDMDDEELAASRPKTAHDQIRVLKHDITTTAGDHQQLLASAKAKMDAGDEGGESDELTDEEMDAYLAEERLHLKKYGKVKLTPLAKNVKVAGMQKASAGKGEEGDLVKVTMFETIDPAPHVGNTNVVRDYGYEKLEKGNTYLLPKNVAIVLAEGKKGAIHG